MANHKVTGKNGKELHSSVALHPGEILAEELAARKISQRAFAAMVDMRPPHINELLKGKRHISATLALKLEKHFKIDAAFWMNLQVNYDLKLARKQAKVA